MDTCGVFFSFPFSRVGKHTGLGESISYIQSYFHMHSHAGAWERGIDNDIRRLFEADTMDTEDRISALKKMKTVGLKTAALICPVIPYITDLIPLINMLAPYTDKIWIYGLSMINKSDKNWQNVAGMLESHFSDLKKQVETVVFSKEHSYWADLRQELIGLQKDMNLSIHL